MINHLNRKPILAIRQRENLPNIDVFPFFRGKVEIAAQPAHENKPKLNSEDREAAPDLESGISTSAERVADLEFLLERQKALTAELHRQVVELTAKTDREMRASLRPKAPRNE
jgi:hypothetical protein